MTLKNENYLTFNLLSFLNAFFFNLLNNEISCFLIKIVREVYCMSWLLLIQIGKKSNQLLNAEIIFTK